MFNSSRLQYEDNRNDEHDGFHILRKIDLNNISNKQQNYLRKIGAADIRTYDQNINEFKTWRDEYQSGNSATTGATTAMKIDGVDGGPKRDSRTRRGRDTGESIEDERGEVAPEASEGGITLYNRNYSSHTKVAILHKNLNLCVIL